MDGCSALLFAISSESQCAPVWSSLTECPTRDEYICSMCSCDRTIRQMEMLNRIARNHWNETVNKYYNLANALFSAYRLLVRQVTFGGDNLANTLVMKKRGERRGGVFGALIVRTPTPPTPMSPQIPPPLHFTNLKANFCQIPNAPLHHK